MHIFSNKFNYLNQITAPLTPQKTWYYFEFAKQENPPGIAESE